jgi:hypothetical protein
LTQSTETGEYTVKFGKHYRERGSSVERQTAFLTLRQLAGVKRLIDKLEAFVAEQLNKPAA